MLFLSSLFNYFIFYPQVLVPPEIIGFNNRTAVEGTMLPIICNATGLPTPNKTITYEGRSWDEEMFVQFSFFFFFVTLT